MNIPFQGATSLHTPIVAKQQISQQTQKKQQEQGLTIQGSALSAQQQGQDATTRLYKQIEKAQESIAHIRENEKLPAKEKQEQIKQIEEEIRELQKQILETQQAEQEKALKEAQEKKEAEEEKQLTQEEREQKVQEAQGKMLAGIALATDKLGEATPAYYKVKEYMTQGKLGMGPKYGGNLSSAAVAGVFAEVSKQGRRMMQSLQEANEAVEVAGKQVESYTKYADTERKEEEKAE